jgi:hypothetical protein
MPESLNGYCANVTHVRKGIRAFLIKLSGLTFEVMLCQECSDVMERGVHGR